MTNKQYNNHNPMSPDDLDPELFEVEAIPEAEPMVERSYEDPEAIRAVIADGAQPEGSVIDEHLEVINNKRTLYLATVVCEQGQVLENVYSSKGAAREAADAMKRDLESQFQLDYVVQVEAIDFIDR